MFFNTPKMTVRPATRADHRALANFLLEDYRVHRHLDWRAPLEWLGSQPFFIAETEGQICGVLACPPDPENIYWLRLFSASPDFPVRTIWKNLLDAAIQTIPAGKPYRIGVIATSDWLPDLLKASGFEHHQDIVVLEWSGKLPPHLTMPEDVLIRPMVEEDLPQVHEVDEAAFAPLWHNSLESIEIAYEQAVYNTVAETSDAIVGYQISTAVSLSGHLARLAVNPTIQRSHIGYELVRDLLNHFHHKGAWRVTVNTQSDNHSSLALYQKAEFTRTGEEFPVFLYSGS